MIRRADTDQGEPCRICGKNRVGWRTPTKRYPHDWRPRHATTAGDRDCDKIRKAPKVARVKLR